jgi:hypothetical protein
MISRTYPLNISKNYSKPLEEAWLWLENNLEKQLKKKVAFENIACSFQKEERVVMFKGRTVSGTMSVNEGLLEISINLPLLYRSFAPRIKSAILSIFKEL